MTPVQGQRWYWKYVSGNIHSETIVEVKKVWSGYAEVVILVINKSNSPVDKVGAKFDIDFFRFNTPEFEYLTGQDKPSHD